MEDYISIARVIVENKICSQRELLQKTRKTDALSKEAIWACNMYADKARHSKDYNELMGIEGRVICKNASITRGYPTSILSLRSKQYAKGY